MAKTRYKTDYVIRNIGDDLSDLLAIHRSVFPGNLLATWQTKDKIIVKVANTGQISGTDLKSAKTNVDYKSKIDGEK
jgi:hypothetical protein